MESHHRIRTLGCWPTEHDGHLIGDVFDMSDMRIHTKKAMLQKHKEYPQVIRTGRNTVHGKLPSEGLQGEFEIVTCVMIAI